MSPVNYVQGALLFYTELVFGYKALSPWQAAELIIREDWCFEGATPRERTVIEFVVKVFLLVLKGEKPCRKMTKSTKEQKGVTSGKA